MNISHQKKITLPNWVITQNISFGRALPKPKLEGTIIDGETFVVINNNLYFDEFKPQNILSVCKSENQASISNKEIDAMKKYFLPFRRLSQIANKNTDNIDGCKIITTASESLFKQIKALSEVERDKRARFWLPSIIIEESNNQINIHNKTAYESLSTQIVSTDKKTILQKITTNLINIIRNKNKSNLVIAIGNREEDLAYVDPFKRLGLNPNKENSFKRIKDLPFRSAFICDENTPLKLRYKLAKIEALCNFDNQLRFVVVNANAEFSISKIAETILLLQKDFANFSPNFRNNISEDLKSVLEHKEILPPNKIDTSANWVPKEPIIKTSFLEMTKNFLFNNKISAALLLTSIAVPLYVKYIYNSNNKN